MEKKITIRDIAKEAGVSAATVSYILNDRKDQKISDETRKKVLQIVNLLGYTSNQTAKSLATGRSGNIALYMDPDAGDLLKTEQIDFLNAFSAFLIRNQYNLIYYPAEYTARIQNADAVICRGTSLKLFRAVSGNNFIPVIALDLPVNDPVFYQVNCDFRAIAACAAEQFSSDDYLFLSPYCESEEAKADLISAFPDVRFVESYQDARSFLLENPGKNLAVSSPVLYELCRHYDGSIYYHPVSREKLFEDLLECIGLAIARTEHMEHDIRVF